MNLEIIKTPNNEKTPGQLSVKSFTNCDPISWKFYAMPWSLGGGAKGLHQSINSQAVIYHSTKRWGGVKDSSKIGHATILLKSK